MDLFTLGLGLSFSLGFLLGILIMYREAKRVGKKAAYQILAEEGLISRSLNGQKNECHFL